MSKGFKKIAVELAREAHVEATSNMQDAVPGTSLRNRAETGQARGRATRTGVLNEDREFAGKYYHNWKNTRAPS